MLRVTIDIIPFGDYERRKTLSRIDIVNVNQSLTRFGNYRIMYNDGLSPEREFEIKKFERNKGHLELVRKVLNKILRG